MSASEEKKCCLSSYVYLRDEEASWVCFYDCFSAFIMTKNATVEARKNLSFWCWLIAFAVTALVTRDHQRDICSWHLCFNGTPTLQQKALSLIYGWYLAVLGLCFQMKTFNVSPTRVLSQPHFDWQIKLYLFTPEFNFMSDKSNHKHSFSSPRRLDE